MRVLIADDDATSRRLVAAVASKDGHSCVFATDGTSAWDLLVSEEIDVLLTDWMMPGLAGPELCRRVRDELPGRYVYIVLITGLAHPEQVLTGMEAGADDYLVKPVDPFALRTRLIAAERMTALHRQVAEIRVQLEQANLELLGQSLTDPLTGLGNRRRLEEDLGRALALAARTGAGYSIVLLDVDHFKLYNDRYGHLAGDSTLHSVAQALQREVRAGESTYRYGGEEFLLLLNDCDSHGARIAANRVRQAVLDERMAHEARPDAPYVVTVSAGVASWVPDCELSAAELVERADKALYVAKSSGRNRVHVASEPRVSVARGATTAS